VLFLRVDLLQEAPDLVQFNEMRENSARRADIGAISAAVFCGNPQVQTTALEARYAEMVG